MPGYITNVEDIFSDPYLLDGNIPDEIRELVKGDPNWVIDALTKGTHAGTGQILREIDLLTGNLTGRNIQWHPGGGHHGPTPYWKVSSPKGGTVRVGPQFSKRQDGSSMIASKVHLDLEAPIIPNQSLGGLTLGTHISELEDLVFGLGSWKEGACTLISPFEARYSFGKGEIEAAVDVRNGKIFKLSAKVGYKGKLFEEIGVGMLVQQALELEPRLYYDEVEELILARGLPGLSLDIPEIDPPVEIVPGMNISAINVFVEEIGSGR